MNVNQQHQSQNIQSKDSRQREVIQIIIQDERYQKRKNTIQMNEISEFTVNQPSILLKHQQPLSLTPQQNDLFHLKSHPQTTNTTFSKSTNSHYLYSPNQQAFRCQQCSQHLSNLTQIKKREIKLQYEMQKLKEEIVQLKRENQHLKQLQYSWHQKNIEKYNPMMYFKQDLQAELYQAKYLLQLHTLAKFTSQQQHPKPLLTIKQSQKQQQSFQKLSKPIDLKTKCEQLLLENIKLQEKTMIKDKIIEDRVLFPLYHYDQRILMLRRAVEHWYRRAEQQSIKLELMLKEVNNYQKQLQRQTKSIIMQETIHWENQFKKILSFLYLDQSTALKNINLNSFNSYKNCHNQIEQKQKLSKTYNQNILIQEDHTIFSLCQKINDKSNERKQKITKRNISKNPHVLCQSCLNGDGKKSKNCSIVQTKQKKSINKITKNSGKNENKYEGSEGQRKNEDISRKKVTKKVCLQQSNNNSSILGKNFQNIQIRVKGKQKCESNCRKAKTSQTKHPISQFSCQRCAQKNI